MWLSAQADTNVKVFKHKDLKLIEPTLYSYQTHLFDPDEEARLFAPFAKDESLQTQGSITRGITVGSNRDLSMAANLQLEIRGMLSEDLFITAHISDENLPLQASSAYSLQGKDFDRIYIRLDYKDKAKIWAGDVELNSSDSYFLRFQKQGKGLKADFSFRDSVTQTRTSVRASAAVAKGNFCRQTLSVRDGVQGAYRLQGANGETQIMLLPASEKVYLDGMLLQRGEDADYVVDYQLAEITFTVRQPMTADKRVVVEFEYADQSYLRTLTHLQTRTEKEHWQWSFDFYNEQDMKRQPIQLELDAGSTAFLSGLGNGTTTGYYPNADSVEFVQDEILYKRIDTVVAGIRYDTVYVFSTDRDSACYRLRFSYMGEGGGDYVRVQHEANGQVYAWIAPVNGQKQGEYEPVSRLVAPNRLQQYSSRWQYADGRTTFMLEAALSNNDPNLFAANDSSLLGAAMRTRLQREFKWGGKAEKWRLSPALYYEWKGGGFQSITTYREVEFMRDYNLSDSVTNRRAEHFLQADLQLLSPCSNSLSWQSVRYMVPLSDWSASRHRMTWHVRRAFFSTDADLRLMHSETSRYRTLFGKGYVTASAQLWKLRIGMEEDAEWNRYRSDTVSWMSESRAYREFNLFVQQRDSNARQLRYRLAFGQRANYAVWEQSLRPQTYANHLKADLAWRRWRNHPLQFSMVYRTVESMDSVWTELPVDHTLLGSLNYQGRFAKGAVQTSLYYTLGTAMEEKMAYSYLRVADGQGVYQWNDYNGNGREELDEFEIAVFRDEANYIRVYQVSMEKTMVYANSCTQSLVIRPAAVWQQQKGWRGFASRFVSTTSFQSQLKRERDAVRETTAPLWNALNPYLADVKDSLLEGANIQWRELLAWNPSRPLGGEASYQRGKSKYLTVQGFEYNATALCQLSLRYRWLGAAQAKLMYKYMENESGSSYMLSKNYLIAAHETSCHLQSPVSTHLTVGASYAYRHQQNNFGEERAFSHKLTGEFSCRFPQRGTLYVQCRYDHILFHGDTRSAVAYLMMEALSNGNNGIVTLSYQTRLGEYLYLDVSYECRLLTDAPVQHLGSVSFRAQF